MTSKEFKIWLEGFLTPLNLDNMDGKKNYSGVNCLLYTSPSPRDPKTYRMPSSA